MGLSNKQRIFVDEYLKCWNATEAARRAGYSEKYLHTNATKVLRNTTVADEIKKRLEESAMTADEVLLRLSQLARGDVADYMTPQGVDMKRIVEEGMAHLIKKHSRTKSGTVVEFYDVLSALQLMGKHHKLFVDRTEVTGADGKELTFRVIYDKEDLRDPAAASTSSTNGHQEQPSEAAGGMRR